MLIGINPLLNGDLLAALDTMGHSDVIVLADAHFPAYRLGAQVLDFPGVGTPELTAAVCSVLPLDDVAAVSLMETADGSVPEVQHQLAAAAGQTIEAMQMVERFAFYDLAETAFVVVRTGETRTYANVALRKGVVAPTDDGTQR